MALSLFHRRGTLMKPRSSPATPATLLTIALVLLWFGRSIAMAQGPPQPWPQRGDTDLQEETIDGSVPINLAGVVLAFGDLPFETLIPFGDFTYTDFNSWDHPYNNSLGRDTSRGTTNVLWRESRWLLGECPGPGDFDCTTGGGVAGKTYGALLFRVRLTPGITLSVDRLQYLADWSITLPAPGSFAPGDTVTIRVDVQLDSAATLLAAVRLDSATMAISPRLDPLFATLQLTACVLGTCATDGPTVNRPLEGDTLTVDAVFNSADLAGRGVQGQVRLPQITLTDSRVEDGRRITVSGEDAYATLDWDLDEFLCGGCLSGRRTLVGTTIDYLLLAWKLHTSLRTFTGFTVEPRVIVTLDFDGVELEYVVTDPDGAPVESGVGSSVSFALGNALGLVIPSDFNTASLNLSVQPSITVQIPDVDYEFRHITGPRRRDIAMLRARYSIPAVTAGPFSFDGATFTLGPGFSGEIVSDSFLTQDYLGTYAPDSVWESGFDLAPVTLAPELPTVSTTFGAPGVSLALLSAATADAAVQAARVAASDDLSQPVTVLNIGNVHLANLAVAYELRRVSNNALVSEGEAVAREYLEMLEPADVDVPLELETGRQYRLGVTVRAESPIGTAMVSRKDLTIGMYDMNIGAPTSVDGVSLVPVTVRSSAELDVRRIDPASVKLVGVAATTWSWTTTEGRESLTLQFPLDEVSAAARTLLAATPTSLASDQVLATLFGDGEPLTEAQVDLLDRLGNANGRVDIGDLRAYLMASGELPGVSTAVGNQTDPPTTLPVKLLLTGLMAGDQRAYGLGIFLLPGEES